MKIYIYQFLSIKNTNSFKHLKIALIVNFFLNFNFLTGPIIHKGLIFIFQLLVEGL